MRGKRRKRASKNCELPEKTRLVDRNSLENPAKEDDIQTPLATKRKHSDLAKTKTRKKSKRRYRKGRKNGKCTGPNGQSLIRNFGQEVIQEPGWIGYQYMRGKQWEGQPEWVEYPEWQEQPAWIQNPQWIDQPARENYFEWGQHAVWEAPRLEQNGWVEHHMWQEQTRGLEQTPWTFNNIETNEAPQIEFPTPNYEVPDNGQRLNGGLSNQTAYPCDDGERQMNSIITKTVYIKAPVIYSPLKPVPVEVENPSKAIDPPQAAAAGSIPPIAKSTRKRKRLALSSSPKSCIVPSIKPAFASERYMGRVNEDLGSEIALIREPFHFEVPLPTPQ